ncbi:MAG: ABC-2 family transporter protein [Chloroflexota bacterium]|nr:ABC-2 family transporter protein [Chloroflexota bacterium]
MSRVGPPLAGYVKLAQLQFAITYAYRFQVIGFLLSSLLQIFLLKVVWTAVYDGRSSVDGVSLSELITFLTLANLQLLAMQPILVWYLERRIHEGRIGLDLVRPLPFLGQLLAQQLGATIGYLPFLVIAIPFAFILGLPASPVAAGAYLVSLVLGYAVAMLIGLLMGLVAFWTVQTLGVAVIYRFAAQFFGGALIPLFLMPDGLRLLAELLPFQAQVHVPLSIYTGRITGADAIAGAVGLQLFWVGALALLAWLMWQRARRIVTVYGG